MSIDTKTKLNRLLASWPEGAVYSTQKLIELGYGSEFIQKYKNSHWIEPLGKGAYKKNGDSVEWFGGVECLQSQLKLRVHVGGKAALELLGKAQYIPLNQRQIILWGDKKELLPAWFRKHTWDIKLKYQSKKLFIEPKDSFSQKQFGFIDKEFGKIKITISSSERSFLEYLNELPKKYSYKEALDILENLPSMRSSILQTLLENCTSLKVKRLFLHMADKTQPPWLGKINIEKINLGKGKRHIFKNGFLDPKYQITVPKDFYEDTQV